MNYFIWFGGVVALNTWASIFAQKRAEKLLKLPYEPLPDLVQQNTMIIYNKTPDYILLFLMVYCYFYIPMNYIGLNALLKSLSIRPFFIVATTLPACSKKQEQDITLYSKIFLSTHDLMFSGHTCMFSFFGTLTQSNIVHYIFPITLILSRQHYTIDILCSLIVYNYFYLTSC